jgi:regulatory protein
MSEGETSDWLDEDTDASRRSGKDRKRRKPRKMTAKRLHAIALAYLDRYETSEAGFRAMLERRVFKSAVAHGDNPDTFASMIEEEVRKALDAGFIDNARFATNQVYQQRGRGASARAIAARLKAKGVADDLIQDALAEDERDDEAAAQRYARRRRLGPYRLKDRAERRERDMAALCRAGFSFGLAARVIDGDSDDL